MTVQPEFAGFKVDWELRRLPIVGFYRPWINCFQFPDQELDKLKLMARSSSVQLQFSEIDFNHLLHSYNIKQYFDCAEKIAFEFINAGKVRKVNFPPHFRNTLFMLHGIKEAHSLYEKSDFLADLVLRIRPDFLMADDFIAALEISDKVLMPVRNSGQTWDYGWGYASDMAFAGNPALIKKLSNAITYVPVFWAEDRVRISESRTLPFIYGDAIFSFLINEFGFKVAPIANAGELIRPIPKRFYPYSRGYRRMRHELKSHARYLTAWKKWQKLPNNFPN